MEHIQRLGDRERAVLAALLRHQPIVRDTNAVFIEQRTFGERLADQVASFGGSWIFLAVMGTWILWNVATK